MSGRLQHSYPFHKQSRGLIGISLPNSFVFIINADENNVEYVCLSYETKEKNYQDVCLTQKIFPISACIPQVPNPVPSKCGSCCSKNR
ncbi:hypothetical protein KUTeg_014517 [Tegillarca granosa]|uniref:Uncharacterized protein n=1 Tax=Tegillarca granosa TaxID=220873 RepID=A0ABQ9ERS2_TEGGR|nr:hypothetical protein KUTeg_014517 [Tegillarca granosa]